MVSTFRNLGRIKKELNNFQIAQLLIFKKFTQIIDDNFLKRITNK
jgi:hypothetical protein